MGFFSKRKIETQFKQIIEFCQTLLFYKYQVSDNQAHISIVLGAGIISRAILES